MTGVKHRPACSEEQMHMHMQAQRQTQAHTQNSRKSVNRKVSSNKFDKGIIQIL